MKKNISIAGNLLVNGFLTQQLKLVITRRQKLYLTLNAIGMGLMAGRLGVRLFIIA
jgi:hypothetical protein